MKKFLFSLATLAIGTTAFAGTVTFDFLTNDYGLPAYNKDNTNATEYAPNDAAIESGNVKITFQYTSDNTTNGGWRMWSDGLRAYYKQNPSFTVTTTNGENIKGVTWVVASGATFALEGTTENLTSWNGSEISVTFDYTATSNKAINSITVAYGDSSLEPDPIPETKTSIGSVEEGDMLNATAVVTAQCSRGLILSDNTGSILYYNQNLDLSLYPIGTKLTAQGKVSKYNRGFQLDYTTTLTVIGSEEYNYPTPTVYTPDMLTVAVDGTNTFLATYVSLTGKLNINNNYYNIIVDGTEVVQGSLYYPTDEIKDKLKNGNTYNLFGYFVSVSGSSPKYFNILVNEVELVQEGPSIPSDVKTTIGSVEVGDKLSTSAVVTAQCSRGLILTDNTGSILYYNPNIDLSLYPIGTTLNVEGTVSFYNHGLQLENSAVLSITGNQNYTYPSPTVYTAQMLTDASNITNNILATYVSLEGKLSVNNNYYNIIVDGTDVQGSLYYLTEEAKEQLVDGNIYNFYGYFNSVTSKYFYIVFTEATLIEDATPTPEVVTSIAQVTDGCVLETTAVVTGQSGRGLILTDETGSIFYYNNNVDLATYAIGTKVNVTGNVSVYGTGFQLSNAATLEVVGTESYTYPTPIVCTAELAAQEIANTTPHIATYATIEGTLSISGQYYNVIIPGLENGEGSLYTPTEALNALLVNENTYKFTGYYTGVTNGKYLYMVLTDVELIATGEQPKPDFTGESVTFDFTDPSSLNATLDGAPLYFNDTEVNEFNLTGATLTEDPISISCTASEDVTNGPRLWSTNGNWTFRFYKDNTVTIYAHAGYKIEGIVFEATNLGNESVVFTGNGQFANNVWTSYENSNVINVIITKTATGNTPTISAMTVYYLDDPTNGVNEIANDLNAPVEYFNLQGQKVLNPSNGIFIIRQGNKTSKVVIR